MKLLADRSGFPDPASKTRGFASATNALTTYTDLINISGSGYLIGMSQSSPEDQYTKIVIDGVTMIDLLTAPTSVNKNGAFNLPMMLRFRSSLQIQIKSGSTSYTTIGTVSYILD